MSCGCSAGCAPQCGGAYRCVSNASGAWAAMVLLGVGVGFLKHATYCVMRNTINCLRGVLKLQAYSQLHMKMQVVTHT